MYVSIHQPYRHEDVTEMCLVHGGFLNQLSWPEEWESTNIAVKKVVGSLCSCAVVQAINSRKAKNQDMTRLLYCLLFFTTYFKFILLLARMQGTKNLIADAIFHTLFVIVAKTIFIGPSKATGYLHTPQGACARQEVVRLDITALEGVVQKRLHASLSNISWEQSSRVIDLFWESSILRQCWQMKSSKIKYYLSYISYLSALCYAKIARNLPNSFAWDSFSQLEYDLKGVKTWAQEGRSQAKPRLPITPAILKCLQLV